MDWVIDESEAPRYRVTTFDRTPAVEVYLDNDVVSSAEVLDRLSQIVSVLPQNGAACTESGCRPASVSARSSAVSMSSEMSSGYDIPEAIQHFGNIEIGVNPGIVFSSLTYERVFGEEEVDPREPAAVDRVERADAELLDPARSRPSVRSAGHTTSAPSPPRYLPSKS